MFYRDRRTASTALNELMDVKGFDDPRSVDVLARLVHSLTCDGDLVVDFFAGSGSTGHAVWEQNLRDEQSRRWVLVQAPESTYISTESGKNAAREGYSTIFDITAERLRRAAAMLGAESLGFRVFLVRQGRLALWRVTQAADPFRANGYEHTTGVHRNVLRRVDTAVHK